MKSPNRFSKASGSDRRRVDDILLGRGRFSPKAIARRKLRQEGRHG